MIPFLIIFCGALAVGCVCWVVGEMFSLQDRINAIRHKELLKKLEELKK